MTTHGSPQSQFYAQNPPNINTYVRIPWLHNFQFTHNLLSLVILENIHFLRVYIFISVMEPPSPRTYNFLADTLDVLLFRDSQSDPNASRQLPSPSESHESLLETVSNDIKNSIPFPGLEPQLFKTYRGLSSFLGCSRDELLTLVSCHCRDQTDFLSPSPPMITDFRPTQRVSGLEKIEESVRKLLYWSLATGFAYQWPDFPCWVDIAHSFAAILRIKKRELALTEEQNANIDLAKKLFGIDCVGLPSPTSTRYWEESDNTGDSWIRAMYKRNFDPSVNFKQALLDIQNCHTTDDDREPESRRYDIYHH
jgi:hypothetical protein